MKEETETLESVEAKRNRQAHMVSKAIGVFMVASGVVAGFIGLHDFSPDMDHFSATYMGAVLALGGAVLVKISGPKEIEEGEPLE